MRAISLWQPWASLIAIGAKLIETRSWYTPYRGPLVIHASAALHPQCREAFRDKTIRRMLETYGCTAARIEDLPRKALLAVCELRAVDYTKAVQFVVDAKPQSWYRQSANSLAGLYNATLGQRALGNFEPGRYAWFLSDVQPLRQPIRYAGQRSFFQVPDTILSHLEQKGCVNG